jgi:hypothetical protein
MTTLPPRTFPNDDAPIGTLALSDFLQRADDNPYGWQYPILHGPRPTLAENVLDYATAAARIARQRGCSALIIWDAFGGSRFPHRGEGAIGYVDSLADCAPGLSAADAVKVAAAIAAENVRPGIIVRPTYVARVMADLRVRDYNAAKRFKQEADIRGMFSGATKIPNDATVIPDGAAADGRKIITGADLYNLYNRCADIIADFEATTNAKLNQLARISPAPTARAWPWATSRSRRPRRSSSKAIPPRTATACAPRSTGRTPGPT